MKKAHSRRSFLFGVGACAAGLFLPKAKKLIFPVSDNPLAVLEAGPFDRVGNREVYVWAVNCAKTGLLKFRECWGRPPNDAGDGREIQCVMDDAARSQFESGFVLVDRGSIAETEWKHAIDDLAVKGKFDPQKLEVSQRTLRGVEFNKRAFEAEKRQDEEAPGLMVIRPLR